MTTERAPAEGDAIAAAGRPASEAGGSRANRALAMRSRERARSPETLTASTIVATQRADGGIPWWPDGPLDPWNHVEAAMGLDVAGFHAEAGAAYLWLAHNQNPDGSWFAEYSGGEVTNSRRDTNFTAYIAVGASLHALRHGCSLVERLWPAIDKAIEFVLGLQQPGGEIPWHANGEFLLTGCSSIHHALRQACVVADLLGHARPRWARAADRLRAAIVERPGVFTPKPHAMDWYYPVLGSVLTGPAAEKALAARWDEFVVPDLGVRCVHDQPWVTGGETAELALTLATRGDHDRARRLLAGIERLRHPDGSYWTGYQYATDALWPDERTTWTSGAVLLATAALSPDPATNAVFGSGAAEVIL